MDFTREPVVETVITPKEGSKIVVRSSKGSSQEEYFVDAVEIVSFGNAFFFRSLEKPKTFLLPVADYEILEVREARMVLKHVGIDKTIKIGKAQPKKESKTQAKEKEKEAVVADARKEGRLEKKRERRRHTRRRRTKEESPVQHEVQEEEIPVELPEPELVTSERKAQPSEGRGILTSLLPPPPTLISETIAKYREGMVQEKKSEEKKDPPLTIHEEDSAHPILESEEAVPGLQEKKRSFWDFTRELTGRGPNRDEE